MPDAQCATTAIEVRLMQRERFVDAEAGSPQHREQPAKPLQTVAGDLQTATISVTVGGSAGYRRPLLRGGRPA